MKKQEKSIIIGHKDKCYLQSLKIVLVQNGYNGNRIRLVQSLQEFIRLCNERSYDIAIIHDQVDFFDRIEKVVHFLVSVKRTKKILWVDRTNLESFQNIFWVDASILDYQSDGVVQLLKVMNSPLEEYYLSPTLTGLANKSRSKEVEHSLLSKSDLQVIQHICADYTSQEIAILLKKATRTIEGQRLKIKNILGVSGTVGIVLYAIENDIYTPRRPSGKK